LTGQADQKQVKNNFIKTYMDNISKKHLYHDFRYRYLIYKMRHETLANKPPPLFKFLSIETSKPNFPT